MACIVPDMFISAGDDHRKGLVGVGGAPEVTTSPTEPIYSKQWVCKGGFSCASWYPIFFLPILSPKIGDVQLCKIFGEKKNQDPVTGLC